MKYAISIKQKKYEIEIGAISNGTAQVTVNGAPYQVQVEKQADRPAAAPVFQAAPAPAVAPAPARTPSPATAPGAGTITAPIPGLIVDIPVSVGDMVKAGQVVVVMEAMKMENRLITTVDGQVKEVRFQKGAQVATGDVILVIG
ncbi:MAG: biotin/lipoyl-containing protein [Thermodesulfobacteriota bacterium]